MQPNVIRQWISSAALVVSAIFAIAAIGLLLGVWTSPENLALAAPASALVAGSALLFNAWQYGQKASADQSKFALDMAMEGVKNAFNILNAPRVDNLGLRATRVQWVNASRVLARALQTAKSISSADHKDAWDLFREEWRLKFYFYIRRSPEYYLGLHEPLDYENTAKSYPDEKIVTLLRQTNVEREFNMSHYHSSGTSNSDLAEHSIKVIYDFTQYGDDWTDPLDSVEAFSKADIERTRLRDHEGLHVYLRAKREWFVIGDRVETYAAFKARMEEADGSDEAHSE